MKKIVIANNKNGVIQATTTYHLASYYAHKGKRILIIDCHPQSNLTKIFEITLNSVQDTIYDNIKTKHITNFIYSLSTKDMPYLFFIPYMRQCKELLIDDKNNVTILDKSLKEIERYFDICIMDISFDMTLLSMNAMFSAESVYFVLHSNDLTAKKQELLNLTIEIRKYWNKYTYVKGIILTHYNVKKSITNNIREQIEEYFSSKIMKTVIRQNFELTKPPINAQNIFSYHSLSDLAKDYKALAQEILQKENLT